MFVCLQNNLSERFALFHCILLNVRSLCLKMDELSNLNDGKMLVAARGPVVRHLPFNRKVAVSNHGFGSC